MKPSVQKGRVAASPVLLIAAALLGMAAVLVVGCFDSLAGGGDATETGNALAGTLVLPNGQSAAGARIYAVPQSFNPVRDGALHDTLGTVANANGNYGFKALAPGRYNVQIAHPASGYRAFLHGLVVGDAKIRRTKDTVKAPGSLLLRRPDWIRKNTGRLYVPGSLYSTSLAGFRDEDGQYLFDSLPPGSLPEVRYLASDSDSVSIRIADSVKVQAGKTQVVHPYAGWSRSVKVLLHAAASATSAGGMVTDFPLLVRLTPSVFDFTQAAADGGDLRFAKSDGKALSFEIEYWKQDSAAVWVRLDTLRANDASPFIFMYWGHSQAALPIDMPKVFDSTSGFAGVWHLDESAADTLANGLYRDATPGGSHGNDRIASEPAAGVIGVGQSFAKGDYIQTPLASQHMRLTQGYTLSAWFRSTLRTSALGCELISVGDNYGLRLTTDGRLHTFFWPVQAPPAGQDPWYSVGTQGTDFLDGEWHFVQGSYDGSVLRLFLDGKEMALLAVPGVVDFRFPLNVTMGRHGNVKSGFDFIGNLDEVQIHAKPRALYWHQLTFENQKPGSIFPAFAAP
jgi:Concanavalin A-like lectin/glucanases superfamily/Domain of unknown function (DUF2341)